MVIALAVLGWVTVAVLAVLQRRRVRPFEPPTKVVLVNASGLPESLRAIRGEVPAVYHRPKGREASVPYRRVGIAIVFQADR